MRHLVILTCVIVYVIASPVQNEEINKTIEDDGEKKGSDIILDINENGEISETAEGREVMHLVKSKKNGGKTIHIHSSYPPDINIMPMQYQTPGNMPNQQYPYRPMRYRKRPNQKPNNQRGRDPGPKNQVNIYVYFNKSDSEMMPLEVKMNNRTVMSTPMPVRHVTIETSSSIVAQGISMPEGIAMSGGSSQSQGTSQTSGATGTKRTPTLIAVCPPGHVKVLGACVEYDID